MKHMAPAARKPQQSTCQWLGLLVWPTSCPRLLLHTILLGVWFLSVGGLWERLDARGDDPQLSGPQLLSYPGAKWAAEAYQGWPTSAGLLVKQAYFLKHFPALFLHGMVFHWYVC